MREFVAIDLFAPGESDSSDAPPHLTLRFLGEVSREQESWVRDRLHEVAEGSRPFVIRLEGLGAFPSPEHPRVVWVGVTSGRPEIVALAERVRAALAPRFGLEREAFVPHLTLWRVRSPRDRRAAEELLRGERPPPPPRDVPVSELLLKESVLASGGAVHRIVEAVAFGTAAPD